MLNTINCQGNIKQNHNEWTLHSESLIVKQLGILTGGNSIEELKIAYIADENVKWLSCFGKQFGGFIQRKAYISISRNSSA